MALPGQVMETDMRSTNNTIDRKAPSTHSSTLPANAVDKLGPNVRKWFNDQNGQTLSGALAFVPFILQQAYFDGQAEQDQIVVHKGAGAVVFSDASGFTALTEKLAKSPNGAELLSACLTAFFTPLIDLINAYRGDTIKFSGDALTIYFPAVDDTKLPKYSGVVPPHGTYGVPDLGPMATAVLRASACCVEIHKRLHNFDTGVGDVKLCLHIGVGCGPLSIMQVGGIVPPETHVPRMEYLISGEPLEQISYAEPLAKNGETCLSPQAWAYARDCVIEGPQIEERPEFHLLLRMDESRYTFPAIKYATRLYDTRAENMFKISELKIARRYIPSFVYKQIESGTLQYVNEMRTISVIFVSGSGLDVMSANGPLQAQTLMSNVQSACYAHEGTLNKFLIDDKGMLFLLVFGLPPLVHPDDPTRAVLASAEFVQIFKKLALVGRFGVTTGRSYCGICGSQKRMEYTVLGDMVNLSARLMANAPALGILCDEETQRRTAGEIVHKRLDPIKVKGKANPVAIFEPQLRAASVSIGVTLERKIRPPWYDNILDGSVITARDVPRAMKDKVVQLCGVTGWPEIKQVQEMLGGAFTKALHLETEQSLQVGTAVARPPVGSPFSEGGVVVIEGATGMGKIELAEHIVMHCATRFQMMPVFGTLGPRPGERQRMAVELLRSTLGVFRLLNPALHVDDVRALTQLVPKNLASSMPALQKLLSSQPVSSNPTSSEDGTADFDSAITVVISLLTLLKAKTPIVVILQLEHGTSLFEKTRASDQATFWQVTGEIAKLVQKEKQIALLILCREADKENVATGQALEQNTFIGLKGLNEDSAIEYMCNYLSVPENLVPYNLRNFIINVSLGNPMYIRETVDQLLKDEHLRVLQAPCRVECGDLSKTDIASWNHTAMVGGTICQLESLDPIESAALKMSTCFVGSFTLPDLAASKCSLWAGATHFDLLRLFGATWRLVNLNILEAVPSKETVKSSNEQLFGKKQYFQIRNLLIRTVGSAMVLEAQRKAVKRNALINRVLTEALPARIRELAATRNEIHIPWYYEQAMRRMAQAT
mmetsp:Transcript_9152/g.25564  ORF Transcript_9152/g.25564 Transcript_9152/m.25564 type:complete len:1056 (-) Transcript_9152:265-3432(-)